LPRGATWKTIRQRYLVPLALGLGTDTASVRERIRKREGLSAYLLQKQFNLPVSATAPLGRVLEALACRMICDQLGMPPQPDLAGLRRAALHRLLTSPTRLDDQQLRRQLPGVLLGARGRGVDGLHHAILTGWADGRPLAQGAPLPGSTKDGDFDLPAFASTVVAAARSCPTGWFGDNKVFINHLWRHISQEPGLPPLRLAQFKECLVRANQEGLLQLSRADLVQAMDPADVRESETHYLHATFHFLQCERGRQ
jgi:hypothetical protein